MKGIELDSDFNIVISCWEIMEVEEEEEDEDVGWEVSDAPGWHS